MGVHTLSSVIKMPVPRSSSLPPENLSVNQKTGLRGGFPIKISGRALGSQESLGGRASEKGLFGQRIGMRWTSKAPFLLAREGLGDQSRNLRGSTPIRNTYEKFAGPLQNSPFSSPGANLGESSRRKSIGGVMSNGPAGCTVNQKDYLSRNTSTDTHNGSRTQ